MIITKGKTNVSVVLRIIDSTDGTPETGVVWNTAGIDLWYRREGAAVVSITEATLAALTTAHTDGGFLHISHGYYRFDIPDAAFATGADGVQIGGTVTGMVVIGPYVQLSDIDIFDATRGGMTALPNANADAAGGLPISDAGGLDLDARIQTDIAAILADVTGLNGDAMRGTDNAALASVVGALTDAAAAGDPTTADTVMQYIKQLVNVLVGTTGITTYPAEAAPANNVSLAEVIRAIHTDVTGLNGDAMRGTDSAALASVATEARLAELDAANIPADLDAVLVDTNSLNDGAISELAQAAPSATPTLQNAVMLLYMALRNRMDIDTSGATDYKEVYNDAGTVITKKALTDDGSTYSEAEMEAGP